MRRLHVKHQHACFTQSPKPKAQSTKHKAQSTKHKAQSPKCCTKCCTKHKAQSTKAQSTKPTAQKPIWAFVDELEGGLSCRAMYCPSKPVLRVPRHSCVTSDRYLYIYCMRIATSLSPPPPTGTPRATSCGRGCPPLSPATRRWWCRRCRRRATTCSTSSGRARWRPPTFWRSILRFCFYHRDVPHVTFYLWSLIPPAR